MKRFKNSKKKILSGIAVLAVSATAFAGALSLAACKKSVRDSVESNTRIDDDTVLIDTAVGTAYSSTGGKTYYVAPNGSEDAAGTKDAPLALSAFNEDATNGIQAKIKLEGGDTVYLLPGKYELSNRIILTADGAFNKYIRFINAALDTEGSKYDGTEKTVTLDFSKMDMADGNRGVQIYGDFYYWEGIDVCGAGDNGLFIAGSYNTVEYSEFYNNRDSGLQLGRAESSMTKISQWPAYNLVKNCTSHNNYDNEGTKGENADGFAAKLTIGYGNVFDGCIAYRNSDDGWDLYAYAQNGNIGTVIIYNCVAFENGYLEYTQADCNARFSKSNNVVSDADFYDQFENGNSYVPFNGDGNGFKLGGSVMEGDVKLYNCLSFNNRMHGITDNSNPGVIEATRVTSYDNSAVIENDPANENFGQIVSASDYYDETVPNTHRRAAEGHGNIDLARQTYSYNALNGALSVKSSLAEKLDNDAYRASVVNSLLNAGDNTNVIKGKIDADTRNDGGKTNTSQITALNPTEIFAKLPLTTDGVTRNISGLKDGLDGSTLKSTRVHLTYRNAEDHSINMKDILKMNSFTAGELTQDDVGSVLDKTSWNDYTHYVNEGALDAAESADQAAVIKAKESVELPVDEDAVFQDFEVPVVLNGNVSVKWTVEKAEDQKYIVVSESTNRNPINNSEFATILVYRPSMADGEKEVTLKATYTCGAATETKEYTLKIQPGNPSIGRIFATTMTGEEIEDGETYILDQYSKFTEPVISVENGLDYNGKMLLEEQYDMTIRYYYAKSKNDDKVEVSGFTASKAGVFTIVVSVNLKGDEENVETMTYTIMDASTAADVDFTSDAVVKVNRDGFTITGEPSSATGYIYAVTSASARDDLTAENIKSDPDVQTFSFRSDKISQQFANANKAGYTIYYALGNMNGKVTGEVKSATVIVKEFNTTDDFITIAGGGDLDGVTNADLTIYKLTADLDFSSVTYSISKNSFSGMLDGQGHTVKNISTDNYVLYKLNGGTIENIKFENVALTPSEDKAGLFSEITGGYVYNIQLKNFDITGGSYNRLGGISGVVSEATMPLYISQVSLDSASAFTTAGYRVGGLIGHVQSTGNPEKPNTVRIIISDCLVSANLNAGDKGAIGGMVGEFDPNKISGVGWTANDCYMTITNCVFTGVAKTSSKSSGGKIGGMVGDQKGMSKIEITGCMNVGELYNGGSDTEPLTVAEKNASPMFGATTNGTTGILTVTNCIGLFEPYSLDLMIYELGQIKADGKIYFDIVLKLDFENKWSLVLDDDGETLKAPFLALNFLA